MRLPALVLHPDVRAFRMGLFFTTFFAGMLAGPALGGRYAAWVFTAVQLDFGAALLILCPVILWLFYQRHDRGSLPRERGLCWGLSARQVCD
jgi:predicted MFS family arabinose efflux permease